MANVDIEKNDYATEARERWGETSAYQEYQEKTKGYTKDKWTQANDGLMAIFGEFAECKQSGAKADSAEALGMSLISTTVLSEAL